MKPSEQIHELAAGILEETRKRCTPENFARNHRAYDEGSHLRAIGKHLDEEAEKAQRRVALWTALAMIGPGCTEANVNPLLEQAGVDPCIRNGDTFNVCRDRIIAAARGAGLL